MNSKDNNQWKKGGREKKKLLNWFAWFFFLSLSLFARHLECNAPVCWFTACAFSIFTLDVYFLSGEHHLRRNVLAICYLNDTKPITNVRTHIHTNDLAEMIENELTNRNSPGQKNLSKKLSHCVMIFIRISQCRWQKCTFLTFMDPYIFLAGLFYSHSLVNVRNTATATLLRTNDGTVCLPKKNRTKSEKNGHFSEMKNEMFAICNSYNGNQNNNKSVKSKRNGIFRPLSHNANCARIKLNWIPL